MFDPLLGLIVELPFFYLIIIIFILHNSYAQKKPSKNLNPIQQNGSKFGFVATDRQGSPHRDALATWVDIAVLVQKSKFLRSVAIRLSFFFVFSFAIKYLEIS